MLCYPEVSESTEGPVLESEERDMILVRGTFGGSRNPFPHVFREL